VIINWKTYIFGYCRNMLGRLLSHELKTLRFLACTSCADFRESDKPYQALYSNRQAGNVFVFFKSTVIPVIHHSPTYNRVMQRNYNLHDLFRDLLIRVSVVLIRVYKWLISPDRTSDTANDRLRGFGFFRLPLKLRGLGEAVFFTSLLNFTPSCETVT
jgi:hypothetical protein